MSWQQDEPKVMDEEMLQQAIVEQGPQGQAGKIAKKEGIKYEEVLQLRLDFRSKNQSLIISFLRLNKFSSF